MQPPGWCARVLAGARRRRGMGETGLQKERMHDSKPSSKTEMPTTRSLHLVRASLHRFPPLKMCSRTGSRERTRACQIFTRNLQSTSCPPLTQRHHIHTSTGEQQRWRRAGVRGAPRPRDVRLARGAREVDRRRRIYTTSSVRSTRQGGREGGREGW